MEDYPATRQADWDRAFRYAEFDVWYDQAQSLGHSALEAAQIAQAIIDPEYLEIK